MDGAADARRLVVVALGTEEYGLPAALVREVVGYSAPRPVPGSPMHVEGVINLRGRIIPVVDLRRRFGAGGARPDGAQIVVVAMPGLTVGVVVDETREVLTLPAGACRPQPGGHDAVEGVATLRGRSVVVLDIFRLLAERPLAA